MSNRNQCQLGQTVPGQCIYKNITGDMAKEKTRFLYINQRLAMERRLQIGRNCYYLHSKLIIFTNTQREISIRFRKMDFHHNPRRQ